MRDIGYHDEAPAVAKSAEPPLRPGRRGPALISALEFMTCTGGTPF